MNRISLIVLIFIVVLASFLRLWNLGIIPPSPNWDEVALGYNAFSIRETGKDEYGALFPFILRSYDDYKPALYTYLVIPSITLFGLTPFAVRFPSSVMGIIAVVLSFLLVRLLVGKKITIGEKTLSNNTFALAVSFFLAISPWHIQFSRIAFESNVGLTINMLGVVLFLFALRRSWLLPFSAGVFALNLYMYQSEKVFSPLLVIVLIILFIKEIKKISIKTVVVSCIVGGIVAFPMVYTSIFDKTALARAAGVSVFANQTELLKESAPKFAQSKETNDLLGLILYNRRFVYFNEIVKGYMSHFNPLWLFIGGDLARHHAPYMGLLYLFELPLLIVGIYQFIFSSLNKHSKMLIVFWFFLAPIPASVTSGVPHAVRTLNFLPTFQIFIACGLIYFLNYFLIQKQKLIKFLMLGMYVLFFIFILLNIGYYLNQYFVQQNRIVSKEWQFGYKEAVEEVKVIEKEYQKIIVSNQPHLDQSYMFFLFYLQYPPSLYQHYSFQSSGGFRENHSFGKYEFRPIQWDREEKDATILFVGRPQDFPEGVSILKTIYFLNGEKAIVLVKG